VYDKIASMLDKVAGSLESKGLKKKVEEIERLNPWSGDKD